MIPRTWILSIVLALIAVSGLQGYRMGSAASENRHAVALAKAQAAQFQAAEAVSRAETLRLAAEAQTASLALELEDAERAASDADTTAFGADVMRRLNKR